MSIDYTLLPLDVLLIKNNAQFLVVFLGWKMLTPPAGSEHFGSLGCDLDSLDFSSSLLLACRNNIGIYSILENIPETIENGLCCLTIFFQGLKLSRKLFNHPFFQ